MAKHTVLTSRPAPSPVVRVIVCRRDDDLIAWWHAVWARRGRQMQATDRTSWQHGQQQAKAHVIPRGHDRIAVEARRLIVERAVASHPTTNAAWRATGLPRGTFFRYLNELREVRARASYVAQQGNR